MKKTAWTNSMDASAIFNLQTEHAFFDETINSSAQDSLGDEPNFRIVKTLTSDPIFSSILAVDSAGQRKQLWTIDLEFLDKWELRVQVDNELSKYTRLRHRNILVPHRIRRWNAEKKYFTLPDLSEESLTCWKTTAKRIELKTVWNILQQLFDAIQFAHQSQLVHRFLNPDRIFYTQDETVHVGAFGLIYDGRFQNGLFERKLPNRFLSPESEQNHPARIDHRSDIYSIGRIMEWLFHELDLLPNFEKKLQQLIAKATARARTMRFQSILELADATKRLADSVPNGCVSVSRRQSLHAFH